MTRSPPVMRHQGGRLPAGGEAVGLHEFGARAWAVWECDRTVYRAGWLRAGIVCPAQLGNRRLPLRDAASADSSPNTGTWC